MRGANQTGESCLVEVRLDSRTPIYTRDLGRSARRAPALYSTGQTGAERLHRKFHGKFRDQCLNEHWFLTLHEAQLVIEAWRR
jgi:hypothetical protein